MISPPGAAHGQRPARLPQRERRNLPIEGHHHRATYYPSLFVYLAAMAKEATEIPVVCIGRINDPVMVSRYFRTTRRTWSA
jgi:hypothetical protein